jgi:hypothetical protein
MFLCSPSSGTGELWRQTESEVMDFHRKHSSFCDWSAMGAKSLLGSLGIDKAYQSLFKQVHGYGFPIIITYGERDILRCQEAAKTGNWRC